MPKFDTENRFALYGTYTDDLIAGSSSVRPERPWTRGVYGSVVSGSEEYTLATRLSDYHLQRTYPFFRSGNARLLRLTSATQVFQDSVMPSVVSLALTGIYGGGKLGTGGTTTFTDELFAAGTLLFSQDAAAITGSSGTRVNNIEWMFSSPFEKKYAQLPLFDSWPIRVSFFSENTVPATEELIWEEVGSAVSTTNEFSVYWTRQPNPLGHKTYDQYVEKLGGAGSFTGLAFTSTNPALLAKVVFGVGLRPVVMGTSLAIKGSTINFCSGATIEGWKYGVHNGTPTKFSCVFRRDRYGHPRDLLEGRPYTKTFSDPVAGGPLSEAGGISFLSGAALAGESDNWLTASVYSSSDVAAAYRVNPYGSGIFDREYKSSMPWFDNDPRRKM